MLTAIQLMEFSKAQEQNLDIDHQEPNCCWTSGLDAKKLWMFVHSCFTPYPLLMRLLCIQIEAGRAYSSFLDEISQKHYGSMRSAVNKLAEADCLISLAQVAFHVSRRYILWIKSSSQRLSSPTTHDL